LPAATVGESVSHRVKINKSVRNIFLGSIYFSVIAK